jgi:hypothetical protein
MIYQAVLICAVLGSTAIAQHLSIDRKSLVSRHNVVNNAFDTLASLSVGNGEFAFTVDATGLQTFPEMYRNGVPLGTQSQWGWHSFPSNGAYRLDETFKEYEFHGRRIPYPVEWSEPDRKRDATQWLRQNPHRLDLGTIGFELVRSDGKAATPEDITGIAQTLDLWSGTIKSSFTFEGVPVNVVTCCHQSLDEIAVRVISALVSLGRLRAVLRFAYPTGGHTDWPSDWSQPQKHTSGLSRTGTGKALIERTLDSTKYCVSLAWSGTASLTEPARHVFRLTPMESDTLELSCLFASRTPALPPSDVPRTLADNAEQWGAFWGSGGAIDFSGSTEPRARELERRIVLSQYLTKIQCSGSLPPQETGLTYNSWFGKFHLEMHWWHAAHFALWGRIGLLEKSLAWYEVIAEKAQSTAERQGFEGVRWPKMTDPSGNESPSKVGPFLIWQQPHIIYFAELAYRQHPTSETLERYRNLVFKTAEFMASYAAFDSTQGRYVLGPALIPAQERFNPATTLNPVFELAYWHWGLATAQRWRERMNLGRSRKWDDILAKLSPLPVSNGVYLASENAPDSYSNSLLMTDHPSVLGAFGVLPGSPLAEKTMMRATFERIKKNWQWNTTWGWDYPMMAMAAIRLGLPETALDLLLMETQKNTFLRNGHNYQDARLRIYLPGNGGLLTVMAMACAGYDGCEIQNPGIPKNGRWHVSWEGLSPIE